MAKVSSAAEFIANWQKGMAGAGATWLRNSQATQKDPTTAAASNTARQKATVNFSAAMADGGSVQQGLQRSGKQGWLAGIVAAGATAMSQGAKKGAAKLNAGTGQKLFAAQQAASAAAADKTVDSKTRHANSVNAMKQAFGKTDLW